MFRNQYDHDVTIWSPQGRIHQIEYAMEAVKQGSATVGVKNKTHAILVALKRAPSDLASYQKKISQIDNHVAISIAGLTADGRQLGNYMRNECMNSRWSHDEPLPVCRLVKAIAHKMQIPTQRYGRRPFGVGILVAGCDSDGPHIYYLCPSANYFNCKATAIGARSQSARTYLEKHLDEFKECSLEELVKHGLRALRDTLPAEVQLSNKNCTLVVVGGDVGSDLKMYDDESIDQFLDMIKGEKRVIPAGGVGLSADDDTLEAPFPPDDSTGLPPPPGPGTEGEIRPMDMDPLD